MQYGEYVRYLLLEKKVKLTELKDKIDVKSRNELYRLFENVHSYDKAKELIDKIISVVEFSEEEKRQIYTKLSQGNMKKSFLKSRKILSEVYNGNIYRADEELYSEFLGKDFSLPDKAQIYISGVYDEKWIGVLHKLLEKSPDSSVSHFVTFSGKEEDVAFELAAVIALSPHANYNVYTLPKIEHNGAMAFITKKDKTIMCLAGAIGRNKRFLQTRIDTDLYEFIEEYFEHKMAYPVKEMSDKLSDYAKELDRWSSQHTHPTLIISGGIHFCEIPFDILLEAFRDAGFFGLPEKSEFTQNIIEAYRRRCDIEKNLLYKKRLIFDKQTMTEFIESGKTIDHMYCFRALTPSERINCLRELVSDCEKSQGNRQIRFLKGKVNRQMTYIDGALVSTFNPDLGYGKGHYIIDIRKASVISVCKDFVENIWENETYTEAQSMDIIKNMIKEAEEKYEHDI